MTIPLLHRLIAEQMHHELASTRLEVVLVPSPVEPLANRPPAPRRLRAQPRLVPGAVPTVSQPPVTAAPPGQARHRNQTSAHAARPGRD